MTELSTAAKKFQILQNIFLKFNIVWNYHISGTSCTTMEDCPEACRTALDPPTCGKLFYFYTGRNYSFSVIQYVVEVLYFSCESILLPTCGIISYFHTLFAYLQICSKIFGGIFILLYLIYIAHQ